MSINKLISELFALKAVKYYDRRKDQELKRKLIVLTMSWECNKLQNVASLAGMEHTWPPR